MRTQDAKSSIEAVDYCVNLTLRARCDMMRQPRKRTMLILVITLALLFGFLNGVNDSANVVATVISSRALRPRAALTLTAIGEFIGPLLFGVAVARVVGDELLDAAALDLEVLVAALAGAIVWNLITW